MAHVGAPLLSRKCETGRGSGSGPTRCPSRCGVVRGTLGVLEDGRLSDCYAIDVLQERIDRGAAPCCICSNHAIRAEVGSHFLLGMLLEVLHRLVDGRGPGPFGTGVPNAQDSRGPDVIAL